MYTHEKPNSPYGINSAVPFGKFLMEFEIGKLYYYPDSNKIIKLVCIVRYINDNDYFIKYKLLYPQDGPSRNFHIKSYFAKQLVELTPELQLELL